MQILDKIVQISFIILLTARVCAVSTCYFHAYVVFNFSEAKLGQGEGNLGVQIKMGRGNGAMSQNSDF